MGDDDCTSNIMSRYMVTRASEGEHLNVAETSSESKGEL